MTVTLKFGVPPSTNDTVNYALFPSTQSQSTAIPAGTQSIQIELPIGIRLPYKVFLSPDWATTHWVAKSNGYFVANFNTPCPASGGILRWGLRAG